MGANLREDEEVRARGGKLVERQRVVSAERLNSVAGDIDVASRVEVRRGRESKGDDGDRRGLCLRASPKRRRGSTLAECWF